MQNARDRDSDIKDGGRVVEGDNIQAPPHYRDDGKPQVITSDTVRQAPGGGRVLVVLVASFIMLGVIWALGAAFHLW